MRRSLLQTVCLVSAGLFALALAVPRAADAGGAYLYEIGTPDVGLASAGWAARAQDASTLFKNPAGMSLLHGNELQAGFQMLYADVAFKPDSNTTVAGNNGDNPIGWFPGSSFFYTHRLSPDLNVGFGLFSNFGLSEQYNPSWAGRYYVKEATLVGLSLMPAVSYRVNEWLSVGAGMNAMYGYMKTTAAVRNLDPAIGDGALRYKDNAWGFGANIGALVEPRKGTRFGVTYRSPMKLDFSAGTSFTGLGPLTSAAVNVAGLNRQLDIGITVPQAVMVSAYHEVTDRLAIMADADWENWSEFGRVDISLDATNPVSLTTNPGYKDTWHLAIGSEYRLSDAWLLTGGFAFDSSMLSKSNRSLALPLGQSYRFGLGAIWTKSENMTVGFAYALDYSGNLSVSQGSPTSFRGQVAGTFNEALHFFTVNLTWGPKGTTIPLAGKQ